MSDHDVTIRLRHILDHSREAVSFASGKSRADLDTNRLLELSLMHLITIIGEAANHVPEDVQNRHSEIAWQQIVGMRNRIIHGYDTINLDTLWQTVMDDLPPLVAQLEKILPPQSEI